MDLSVINSFHSTEHLFSEASFFSNKDSELGNQSQNKAPTVHKTVRPVLDSLWDMRACEAFFQAANCKLTDAGVVP